MEKKQKENINKKILNINQIRKYGRKDFFKSVL